MFPPSPSSSPGILIWTLPFVVSARSPLHPNCCRARSMFTEPFVVEPSTSPPTLSRCTEPFTVLNRISPVHGIDSNASVVCLRLQIRGVRHPHLVRHVPMVAVIFRRAVGLNLAQGLPRSSPATPASGLPTPTAPPPECRLAPERRSDPSREPAPTRFLRDRSGLSNSPPAADPGFRHRSPARLFHNGWPSIRARLRRRLHLARAQPEPEKSTSATTARIGRRIVLFMGVSSHQTYAICAARKFTENYADQPITPKASGSRITRYFTSHSYDSRFFSPHSYRSATIGSTFAARRAGSHAARNATTASNTVAPANTSGSLAFTPYNCD